MAKNQNIRSREPEKHADLKAADIRAALKLVETQGQK